MVQAAEQVTAALQSELQSTNKTRIATVEHGTTSLAVKLTPSSIVSTGSSGSGGSGDSGASSEGVVVDVDGTDTQVEMPLSLFSSSAVAAEQDIAMVVTVFNVSTLTGATGDSSGTAAASTSDGATVEVRAGVNIDLMALASSRKVSVNGLLEPIKITMPTNYTEGLECAFWDETLGAWSTEGVTTVAGSGPLVCETTHLSLFGAIFRGFLTTLQCSQATLFNAESVSNMAKGDWPTQLGAIILWIGLATLIGMFLLAALADYRRELTGGSWHDENFLVPVYDGPPSEGEVRNFDPKEQEANKDEDDGAEEGEQAARTQRGPICAFFCAAASFCGLIFVWLKESQGIREAVADIMSNWFSYFGEIRDLLDSLLAELASAAAVGGGGGSSGIGGLLRCSRAGIICQWISSAVLLNASRRVTAASLKVSTDVVAMLTKDKKKRTPEEEQRAEEAMQFAEQSAQSFSDDLRRFSVSSIASAMRRRSATSITSLTRRGSVTSRSSVYATKAAPEAGAADAADLRGAADASDDGARAIVAVQRPKRVLVPLPPQLPSVPEPPGDPVVFFDRVVIWTHEGARHEDAALPVFPADQMAASSRQAPSRPFTTEEAFTMPAPPTIPGDGEAEGARPGRPDRAATDRQSQDGFHPNLPGSCWDESGDQQEAREEEERAPSSKPKLKRASTVACQRRTSTWADMHEKSVNEMDRSLEKQSSWKSLPKMISSMFVIQNPFGAVFVFDLYATSKMRVLFLTMDIMGSLMVCSVFASFGSIGGKKTGAECKVSGIWEQIGRFLAIGLVSIFIAGGPAVFLQTFQTKKIKRLEYEGCPAWDRQLRIWRTQDKIIWTCGFVYTCFVIFFICLILANIDPGDQKKWSVSALITAGEDLVGIPLTIALLIPVLSVAMLRTSSYVRRKERSTVIQEAKAQVVRKNTTVLTVAKGASTASLS